MEEYARGRKEGRADGRAEERDAAEARSRRLVAALRDAGRAEEFLDAVGDDELYEKLLDEFGISSDGEGAEEGMLDV